MILTDKCKEDFEKWLYQQEWYDNLEFGENSDANMWDYSPDSMQYAVYVDFFDSVGIQINVSPLEFPLTNNFWCSVKGKKTEYFKTRQQAREQAIIKANEIYNESK